MDAIKYLRHEHSKFRKILKQIKLLKDETKKQKRFTAFCEDLTQHEKMEQKTWYPTLRKDKQLSKIIKHLISEEQDAAKAMKRFKTTEYGFMWNFRFAKLSHDVDHHAKEEEQELFPRVREKLSKSELNALGIKMRKFKSQLKKQEKS